MFLVSSCKLSLPSPYKPDRHIWVINNLFCYACIIGSILFMSQSVKLCSNRLPFLYHDMSYLFTETEQLMRELNDLQEQGLCKVCLDEEINMVFLPCGHLVCCSVCAPALSKCPTCRTAVTDTVRTYMSWGGWVAVIIKHWIKSARGCLFALCVIVPRSEVPEVDSNGSTALKRKCHHFDDIFITDCIGYCHLDNL